MWPNYIILTWDLGFPGQDCIYSVYIDYEVTVTEKESLNKHSMLDNQWNKILSQKNVFNQAILGQFDQILFLFSPGKYS